eukprot:GHVR01107785.1.p1 GENE.GHVR01107785.1~~GHVR01107785.1.p1  ORF type:complete len:196 (+),score=110.45 GHVR01107785.1:280-867(+)
MVKPDEDDEWGSVLKGRVYKSIRDTPGDTSALGEGSGKRLTHAPTHVTPHTEGGDTKEGGEGTTSEYIPSHLRVGDGGRRWRKKAMIRAREDKPDDSAPSASRRVTHEFEGSRPVAHHSIGSKEGWDGKSGWRHSSSHLKASADKAAHDLDRHTHTHTHTYTHIEREIHTHTHIHTHILSVAKLEKILPKGIDLL